MQLELFLLSCTSAIILHNNDLLLEPEGAMYIFGKFAKFNVHVRRDLPMIQMLKLDFDDCPCYDNPFSKNSTKCSTYTDDKFRDTVIAKLNTTLEDLLNESAELGYQRKRSASSMLLRFLNIGWNTFQEKEITDLRTVALKSASSIKKIAGAINNLNQEIHVVNRNIYKDLQTLDNKICQESKSNWINIMELHATEITNTYLQQIENEIISFMERSIPKRLEYIHLFKGICFSTCKDLQESQCVRFCKHLLMNLPSEFAPVLKHITTEYAGLILKLEIKIPVITNIIEGLYKIKPFGTIVKIAGISYRKTPNVEKYAIATTNTTLAEISGNLCHHLRQDLLCSVNAIQDETCLSNEINCNYDWKRTNKTCTYRYTEDGVALFTKSQALLKSSTIISITKKENILAEGVHFVKSDKFVQEIHCSKKENIVVRALTNPRYINVTILQKELDIFTPKWSRQPTQFHILNLNSTIKQQMDLIIKETEEMSTTSLIHKVATFILAVFATIGILASFVMAFKLYKRITHMKSEINQLRPIL